MVSETARLSDQQWQVILGGLLGNGHLTQHPGTVRRSLPHGARTQTGRVSRLEVRPARQHRPDPDSSVHGRGSSTSLRCPSSARLREVVYWGDGKKHVTDEVLKQQLTPVALAVWFMDDGSVALRSKGLQERTRGVVVGSTFASRR